MDRKSPELMEYIRSQIDAVGYGSVRIELNDSANHVDVVTEHRRRFSKVNRPNVAVMHSVIREG